MINHKQNVLNRILVCGLTAGCLMIAMTGCGGEEEAAPVVRDTAPPPPPPPAKPKVTPVSDLMVQLGIDDRVMLDEAQAPDNTEDRIALLTFFDAVVRGDEQTVGDMIPLTDREQLEAMVESGQWNKATDDLFSVELYTGKDPDFGEDVVLALYTVDLDLQPQMWTYASEQDGYVFEAVPGPSNILDKITGTGDDLIDAWFAYNKWEMNDVANRPDEIIEIAQRNLARDSGGSKSSSAKPSPGVTPGPAQPGGGRGRRPIPKTPRKPPGPG